MSHFNNSEEVEEDENIKDGKKIVYFLNEKREREREDASSHEEFFISALSSTRTERKK